MFTIIENCLPQGPRWNSMSVTLPDAPNEPQEFYHRDILECVRFLFRDPSLSGDMLYSAAEYFEPGNSLDDIDDSCETEFHCEMNSGDMWVEEEVCYPVICSGCSLY